MSEYKPEPPKKQTLEEENKDLRNAVNFYEEELARCRNKMKSVDKTLRDEIAMNAPISFDDAREFASKSRDNIKYLTVIIALVELQFAYADEFLKQRNNSDDR